MYQSFTTLSPDRPLVHCKQCRGVLLVFHQDELERCVGSVGFDMRCPHCSKDWHLRIEAHQQHHIVELSDPEGKQQSSKKT